MIQPYFETNSRTGKKSVRIVNFAGLNRAIGAGDNQLSDECNVSADFYPALAPRRARGIYRELDGLKCISATGYGAYITSESGATYLYYSSGGVWTKKRLYISTDVKQIVKHGKYFLFFPQKVAYDTQSGSEIDLCRSAGGTYSLHMLDEDLKEFKKLTVSDSPPASPADGDVWFDTSDSDSPSLKRYSTMYTGWFEFAARLVMMPSDDSKAAYRAMGIKAGDRLQISGSAENGKTVIEDGYYEVLEATEDSMTVKCTPKVFSSGTNTAGISISRSVPDMDYVVEYNNRLWGYNNRENELYSSELGNPLSWNNFSTDATASFALKVGTNGNFTAIVPFGSYLLFFKEKCVHKLYGAYPAVYQQSFDEISGVKEGCAATVCPINGTLYYEGTDGIYAYSGAYPTLISAPLGDMKYCAGSSAGSHANKYYIAFASDFEHRRTIYVYDTRIGVWSAEDTFGEDTEFLRIDDALCLRSGERLMRVIGDGECHDTESDIGWSMTTAEIRSDEYNKSHLSKILVRLIPVGEVTVRISVEYDRSGVFEGVKEYVMKESGIMRLPIVPRRNRGFRIRLEGRGDCRICGFNAEFRKVGDLQ